MQPGSSPRLRGTDRQVSPHGVADRFIPAPAGNRSAGRPCKEIPSVHPRACGEQVRKGEKSTPVFGSSPRLRGTAVRIPGRPVNLRFIPAPAGNRRQIHSVPP